MTLDRAEILDAAARAVTVDRAATHGPAQHSLKQIARLWSVRLGVDLRPHQVALMLVDIKTVRAWNNPSHADNWIDIAGYAACGGEIGTWPERVISERDGGDRTGLSGAAGKPPCPGGDASPGSDDGDGST